MRDRYYQGGDREQGCDIKKSGLYLVDKVSQWKRSRYGTELCHTDGSSEIDGDDDSKWELFD